MKGNLVNPVVSPSNITINCEIEFPVNPSNHLLPFIVNSTSIQKNIA